jgi:hypothetical protein
MLGKLISGSGETLQSDAEVIAAVESSLLGTGYDTIYLHMTYYADRAFVEKLIADLKRQVFLSVLDPKGIKPLELLGMIALLNSAYIKHKREDK